MANPDTNLLRATRWKSLFTLVVVLAVLSGIGVALFFILNNTSNSPAPRPIAEVHDDAAVVPRVEIDAGTGMSKEDIYAISRFGYFTIKSNAKTTIYVDGKYIGETPMTRLPLPPGPKKIKAIGPKNKVKQFSTTILGGQDTDEGTIIW